MKQELTPRQKEIYTFIVNFRKENGYSPTFREIGKGCFLASSSTVARHVDNLVRKGYLDYIPYETRTITPKI